MAGPDAVVLDLDGVLVDSEERWDEARRELVADRGGTWTEEATHAMLGMSSKEWSAYVRDELGVDDGAATRSPTRSSRGWSRATGASCRCCPARSRRSAAARRAVAARARVVVERAGHRARARARRGSTRSSARGSPARRSRAASPRPTSTSRPRGGSASTPARCVAVEDSSNGHALGARRRDGRRRGADARLPARARRARARRGGRSTGIADVTPEVVAAAFAAHAGGARRVGLSAS